MWEGIQCPVCNSQMKRIDVINGYIICCPRTINNESHYELHYRLDTTIPYYESGMVHPYLIESYLAGNSNVYKWNEAKGCFSRKVILDIPYIQIPWGNLEAARNKLKLYLLMS